MTNKYFGGVVENKNVCEDVDDDLKAAVLEAVKKADEKMEKLRVADAITEIFNIFRRSNKYIDETTPWTLAKDEEKKARLATVLYNLTEAITIGASLLSSFMPETSGKILAQLNTEKRTLEAMDQFGLYPNGNKVTEKAGDPVRPYGREGGPGEGGTMKQKKPRPPEKKRTPRRKALWMWRKSRRSPTMTLQSSSSRSARS